ncbi:galactokinase [Kitasatospora sp. NPDC005856]|uniref:GHMP family kinase ATP-binding protein n=1 Tax=Kitasatospora sp. NPDC005856 TaxID=3154566 RepID=UPI0033D4AF9F
MSEEHPIRAAVPCRACLSGEDLDWLGAGRSVSLALDLPTTVEVVPGGAATETATAAAAARAAGDWPAEVWTFLRARLPGLAPVPPAVRVRSEAPAASGLSSSTALIVALFRAFAEAGTGVPSGVRAPGGERVPERSIVQWAYEFEFARFNGGGMDHLAVAEGGALLIDGREQGLPVVRERLEFPDDWRVVVVDSGTRKNTGDHIRTVRAQLAAGDPALAAYRGEADRASAAAWAALRGRDHEALGEAMARAHAAMRDFQGMSTPLLEELRTVALSAVGLPLKLSGAGGGGSLVGVCRAADAPAVVAGLAGALRGPHPGARVIPARAAPGSRGARARAGAGAGVSAV